jgi:hypothetical protein
MYFIVLYKYLIYAFKLKFIQINDTETMKYWSILYLTYKPM